MPRPQPSRDSAAGVAGPGQPASPPAGDAAAAVAGAGAGAATAGTVTANAPSPAARAAAAALREAEAAAAAAAVKRDQALRSRDVLPNAGYVPGYRVTPALSLSPYSPRVGALPGGLTPGFGAPMPPSSWEFRFTGLLSATFQSSISRKAESPDGGARTVFHVPPQTLDEYASFVGTSTMPGQWVALDFQYGSSVVAAHLAVNTWNPSNPTTYYQIGSQGFINNAFLQFEIPVSDKVHVQTLAGYFPGFYGNLGQYTAGMYTNPISAFVHGIGETTVLRYSLRSDWSLELAHGILGNRGGQVPTGVVPTGGNGSANPIFAASWVNHVHVGFVRQGDTSIRTQLHWLVNWAQDDRVQRCATPGDPTTCMDDPTTRGIDEAYVPDGRIDVLGADTTIQNTVWGYLAAGAAFVRGKNTFPLRGLATFGGEGQQLTERWWGNATAGTGKLWVAGANYSASVGRIRAAPAPFSGDGPDIIVNAGVIVAYTLTDTHPLSGTTGSSSSSSLPSDADVYNHRLRYKAGADVLYRFSPFAAIGVRGDRVAPTSKDSGETFYVVAPRVVLRTSWQSRESLTLIYARWFYGPRSHPETGSIVASDVALDDQLIALNVNMWW